MFRLNWSLIAATVAWLGALAGGLGWVLQYESAPGGQGVAPAVWPAESNVRPGPGRFTLLLFLHPRCPCGRVGLEELSRVAARYVDKADFYALFVHPPGAPGDWEGAGFRAGADAAPGVKGLLDEDGREANRFGAKTSGLVLLYDPRGRLEFQGGITVGRGHQGENPGRRALLGRLAGSERGFARNDVFGCPLFGENPPGAEGGRP